MFKENFRIICIKKGVKPSDVCRKIGITPSAYSQWTDESVPRKSTLDKIANELNVTVDELLGRNATQKEKRPDAANVEPYEDEFEELLKLINDRPEIVVKLLAFAKLLD